MADFFQNGVITTLQNFRNRSLEELEYELELFSKRRNMVLLLPALYSEFEGPAMPKIIQELKDIRYLYKIVLSLDRATEEEFKKVKKIMSEINTEVKVIWHDGPRMQRLYRELEEAGFNVSIPGKGRSVWMSLGYILSDADAYAIALHDCDIVNYSRELPARLLYPVVHPALDFEFSKGYYARVTHKLYGRVTRIFYTPLIRALIRILGCNRFLVYLDSFRYALSGEFAFIRTLARGIRISPTWGLEVSMLSEVYQNTSFNRICQVEVMDTYEHKHQKLVKSTSEGLVKMASDIAKTLFRVLAHDGFVFSEAFFRTLLTTYLQEARYAIEKYNALSLINGLTYDRHAEIEAIEVFVDALKKAEKEFIEDPIGVPLMSAWVRVRAALPEISDKLIRAVEEDNSDD
ncbi:MAG TPA: glucosyl-3-phosphoglycerate synthase [Persephonella sp.]|uniref:Glucosyl-3-phosphoglycerate synthase n=2 Tax=Persephonella marina TaxID=309805 RepID=GPGS_PERMH|nr:MULTISPECIES: glucosyl-3-phosphoglycerate synthase [Persephonella]C0QRQ2.1 RecName: Full=Glucosyl-3-phosphoglycerate synthase; Short=GpgS [Persephonella marina EX-H1]ABX75857.1 glucosyl-3-phosphoglycerate synthase [Persephonella marina EX-H1]ACO04915.1 glucosyl-3-phosphoglycerate synthase [Persephonella marina EX-H1]HCB69093.1 glucosyl-3-phosphoglycerate synthase [Persephonella sp.]